MEYPELQVFDEDQRKAVLGLLKGVQDTFEERLETKLAEAGLGPASLDFVGPQKQKYLLKDQRRLKAVERIWKSNGRIEGTNERVTVEQLLKKDMEFRNKLIKDGASTDHPLLVPRVISNIAREAVEPNLVLTPLLQRMQFSAGTQVVFPAWGGYTAADIPEGGEYPERELELAGQVTATIGKSGVAAKVTEEMLRYSQFDIMSMHFRAAGRALARHKEQKVANMITTEGRVIIDNGDTSVKSSTGRDASGAYNGTLTLDDLFYAFAKMVDDGFTPNAMIMHPFAWQIFADEGIARAFGFINGISSLLWQLPQGAPGRANNFRIGGLNQQTRVDDPGQLATTFTNVPSIFPTSFRIVVSPFMPYTDTGSLVTTDIALVDLSDMGILIVDEEVTTEEWTDPARDIRKVKFRERYAVAAINEGRAIGLLKKINVTARSFDFADLIRLQLTSVTDPLTNDGSYKGDPYA